MKKVSLVFPRFRYKSGDPPLGLCSIASYLRKRCDVEVSILDTTFCPSFRYVRKCLQAAQYDIVGVYVSTIMYEDAKIIATMAKELGATVVAGGPHAAISPESLINTFDIVVIGEGEESMVEIVRASESTDLSGIKGIWYRDNGSIYKNPERVRFVDLDSLEPPAFDLVDIERYFRYWHYLDAITPQSRGINIMASRGCKFNCSFCQPTIRKIFGEYTRFKNPEGLVREMRYYMDKYKVNKFFFHDDTFISDLQWLCQFLNIMKRENTRILWGCNTRISGIHEDILYKMHEVGLRCIHFGIESGSQRVLDQIYQKGTKVHEVGRIVSMAKKAGIHVGGFFMFGAPGETVEEINKTMKLAVFSNLDEASFTLVTPFPGTRLYDMVKSDKKYKLNDNYADFDYYKKISYSGGKIADGKLKYFQRKALFLFYLHPRRWKYLFKHFLSIKGITKLYTKVRRFF